MGSSFTVGLEVLPQPGATSSVVELSFCVPPQVTSTGGAISLPDSGFLTSWTMSLANSATPLEGALTAWNPGTLHRQGEGLCWRSLLLLTLPSLPPEEPGRSPRDPVLCPTSLCLTLLVHSLLGFPEMQALLTLDSIVAPCGLSANHAGLAEAPRTL